MTLLKRLDMHIEDMRSRIGIDVAKSSMSTYIYTRRYLGEFIQNDSRQVMLLLDS